MSYREKHVRTTATCTSRSESHLVEGVDSACRRERRAVLILERHARVVRDL
jgi:hypothetical protein